MTTRVTSRLAAAALAALFVCGSVLPSASADRGVPDYTTSEAGNPIFDGYYADPDVAIYDGTYWVFPTTSTPSPPPTW